MRKQTNHGPQTCAVHNPGSLDCHAGCSGRLRSPDEAGPGIQFALADGSFLGATHGHVATPEPQAQFTEADLAAMASDMAAGNTASSRCAVHPPGSLDCSDGNDGNPGCQGRLYGFASVGPDTIEEMAEGARDVKRKTRRGPARSRKPKRKRSR